MSECWFFFLVGTNYYFALCSLGGVADGSGDRSAAELSSAKCNSSIFSPFLTILLVEIRMSRISLNAKLKCV